MSPNDIINSLVTVLGMGRIDNHEELFAKAQQTLTKPDCRIRAIWVGDRSDAYFALQQAQTNHPDLDFEVRVWHFYMWYALILWE